MNSLTRSSEAPATMNSSPPSSNTSTQRLESRHRWLLMALFPFRYVFRYPARSLCLLFLFIDLVAILGLVGLHLLADYHLRAAPRG